MYTQRPLSYLAVPPTGSPGTTVAGFLLTPAPTVVMFASDGRRNTLARFAVIVNIEELPGNPSFPPLQLTGEPHPDNCCESMNCEILKELMEVSSCSCSDPGARLCKYARSGIAQFSNLKVNKMGHYRLHYTVVEYIIPAAYNSDGSRMNITTSTTDPTSFEIIPVKILHCSII